MQLPVMQTIPASHLIITLVSILIFSCGHAGAQSPTQSTTITVLPPQTTARPTGPPYSSVISSIGAGKFESAVAEGSGGGDHPDGAGTGFIVADESFTKRDLESIYALVARQASSGRNYLYQFSPNVIPAAVLRSFAGALVPTFYTADAVLGGRPQVVLSHGQRDNKNGEICDPNAPINIFSGLGNNVTILKEDIPFEGGLIHLVSDFFTPPQSLSQSLASISLTSTFASYLTSNSTVLDSTPLLTVFAPSDAAILAAFSATNATLSASDIAKVRSAHIIAGIAIYSPLLVSGTIFKSVSGDDVNITTGADGAIFVNDAKVIKPDVVVQNGVVHVIDKVLFTPAVPTPTAPPAFTGAAARSPMQAMRMDWTGVGVVIWSAILCSVVTLGGAAALIA